MGLDLWGSVLYFTCSLLPFLDAGFTGAFHTEMFSLIYALVSENPHVSWTSGKAQVNSWQEEPRRGKASNKRNRCNRSECINVCDDVRWKEIRSVKVPPSSQDHKSQRSTSWLSLRLPVREKQRQILLERLPENSLKRSEEDLCWSSFPNVRYGGTIRLKFNRKSITKTSEP